MLHLRGLYTSTTSHTVPMCINFSQKYQDVSRCVLLTTLLQRISQQHTAYKDPGVWPAQDPYRKNLSVRSRSGMMCSRLQGGLTLIFRNRLGMFSSSKGSEPHSSAYRMTPQLHTSTSGPQYSFPEITCTYMVDSLCIPHTFLALTATAIAHVHERTGHWL